MPMMIALARKLAWGAALLLAGTAAHAMPGIPGCFATVSDPQDVDFASMTRAVAVAGNGDVVVAGCGNDVDTSLTVRYSASEGRIQWISRSPGSAAAVAIDNAGEVLVTGWVVANNSMRTLKYRGTTGALLWTSEIVPAPPQQLPSGYALATDANGNVFVTGTSTNGDVLTAKLDGTTGNTQWSRTLAHAAAKAIVVDRAGNALVAGYIPTPSNGYALHAVKYDGISGDVLWSSSLVSPTSQATEGYDAALDADGNLIVSGRGASAVTKFAALTGAVLWTFPSTATLHSVVVDAAGDVFAASNSGPMKLSGASGQVLWAATESAECDGFGCALALDTGGNVAFTGSEFTTTPGFRSALTAGYRGTDGMRLWSQTWPGEVPRGIATDPGGHFAVSTVTFTRSSLFAFRTRKLDGASGALRWQGGPTRFNVDFDGSASDDLVWAHADGRAQMWLMDGPVARSNLQFTGAGTGWRFLLAADFNGDGKSDVIWENADGRTVLHLMSGAAIMRSKVLSPSGAEPPSRAVASGDFDGDGKADLIWQHGNGEFEIHLMDGENAVAHDILLGSGTGFSVTKVADFNGDGKDDLLWTHADGRVAIWLMNGVTRIGGGTVLAAGSGFTAIHTADLNGDGQADIVWRHADGRVAVWLMSGASVIGGGTLIGPGSGWNVAHTADFNGDGKCDFLWTHTDGRAAIWLMDGATNTSVAQILSGGGWAPKRTGDFDGDGKADIVWEHPDGRVAMWLMDGTSVIGGGTILGPGTGWRVSTGAR